MLRYLTLAPQLRWRFYAAALAEGCAGNPRGGCAGVEESTIPSGRSRPGLRASDQGSECRTLREAAPIQPPSRDPRDCIGNVATSAALADGWPVRSGDGAARSSRRKCVGAGGHTVTWRRRHRSCQSQRRPYVSRWPSTNAVQISPNRAATARPGGTRATDGATAVAEFSPTPQCLGP